MNIKSDVKNSLFNRRELVLELGSTKTPNFVEVQTQVAEKLKAESSLVVIKSIRGNFGNNDFSINAFVYSSEEDKKKFEPKPKVKKDAAGGKK